MNRPFTPLSGDEVDALADELIARYGDNAHLAAVHLAVAYRSLGVSEQEIAHALAARKIEGHCEGGNEPQESCASKTARAS